MTEQQQRALAAGLKALAATTRKPKASEFGTPEDSIYLGIPAIQ